MKNRIVDIPALVAPIQPAPGFHKKQLAEFKLGIAFGFQVHGRDQKRAFRALSDSGDGDGGSARSRLSNANSAGSRAQKKRNR